MLIAEAHAQSEILRKALLSEHFAVTVKTLAKGENKKALRKISRLRSKVGSGRAAAFPQILEGTDLETPYREWYQSVQEVESLRAQLDGGELEEQRQSRKDLWQFYQSNRVREALFLLCPNLLDTAEHRLNRIPLKKFTSSDRMLARRLYSFIQRFGAKNETTSFFGPMTYGTVEEDLEDETLGPESPTGISKKEVFPAFWAVTELGRAIARDPAIRPYLPIRRIAASRVTETHGVNLRGQRVSLSELSRKLFGLVDGTSTLSDLSRIMDVPTAELEAALRPLERGGFAMRDLEPLSTTPYPLKDLEERLPDHPSAQVWREKIQAFQDLLDQFADTGYPERRQVLDQAETFFEKTTGKEARRGAGEMYADRGILYEECRGDLMPFHLPGHQVKAMENALTPALNLGATFGQLRRKAVRQLAQRVLEDQGGAMNFMAFAQAMDQWANRGELSPLLEPRKQLIQTLTDMVADANDGHVARLDPDQLAEWVEPPAQPLFASPDVMFQRQPSGKLLFVIGEVHPYVFAWGSQGHFAPDADKLARANDDLRPWGGEERMATVLRRRRHKGLVSEAFPGFMIEVTGRAGCPSEKRLAIADLEVVTGPEGPQLMTPRGPVDLYVGEDDQLHLQVFAPPQIVMPPVRLGNHTPRIEIGDLVFQRERWFLPEGSQKEIEEATTNSELFIAVAKARHEQGWPRYVFAKSKTEPKPILLDFNNPFALEMLRHLLQMGPVALAEMLPSPEGLWLRRSDGGYTSELRLSMIGSP